MNYINTKYLMLKVVQDHGSSFDMFKSNKGDKRIKGIKKQARRREDKLIKLYLNRFQLFQQWILFNIWGLQIIPEIILIT